MAAKIWPGTHALARMHIDAGERVWLVTASPVEVAEVIARHLGPDRRARHGRRARRRDLHRPARRGADARPRPRWPRSGRSPSGRASTSRAARHTADSANDIPLLSVVGPPVRDQPRRRTAGARQGEGLAGPGLPPWPARGPRIGVPAAAVAGALTGAAFGALADPPAALRFPTGPVIMNADRRDHERFARQKNTERRCTRSEYSVCWIVWRTWSVRSKTSIGSSAAPSPRAVGGHRGAELDEPFARQRHQAERAEQRPGRGDRRIRQAEQSGQCRHVADDRVGLLGADDRARDDRRPGPQGGRDEPAPPEPLKLVPLAERLADPLETLRPDADHLAAREQPLGVGVARQRGTTLAGDLADHRGGEDEVGAEHPQVPFRRVLVVDGDLGHQGVERDRARSGWRRRAPRRRSGMFSIPRTSTRNQVPVQRAQDGEQQGVGELGVETEVVDDEIPGEPPAQQRQDVGDPLLDPVRQRGRRRRRRRRGGRPARPPRPGPAPRPTRAGRSAGRRRRRHRPASGHAAVGSRPPGTAGSLPTGRRRGTPWPGRRRRDEPDRGRRPPGCPLRGGAFRAGARPSDLAGSGQGCSTCSTTGSAAASTGTAAASTGSGVVMVRRPRRRSSGVTVDGPAPAGSFAIGNSFSGRSASSGVVRVRRLARSPEARAAPSGHRVRGPRRARRPGWPRGRHPTAGRGPSPHPARPRRRARAGPDSTRCTTSA